jgi:hypothetical protein
MARHAAMAQSRCACPGGLWQHMKARYYWAQISVARWCDVTVITAFLRLLLFGRRKVINTRNHSGKQRCLLLVQVQSYDDFNTSTGQNKEENIEKISPQ